MRLKRLVVLSIFLAACSGPRPAALSPGEAAAMPWDAVVARARGTTVAFAMWTGDEARNRYFRGPVTEALRREHDITLEIVPLGDTVEMVNKLVNEKQAGKTSGGSADMLWINGENFRTAKQGGVLWGPFADRLPNIRYYDEESRARDFGTPIDGYEAPWQRSQFVVAYDSARTPDPPRSIEALRDWIKAHPGRFTYVAPPDFTGSCFLRHVLFHFGGGARAFRGGFDEVLYERAAAATVDYLNEIEPYLWRRGETYPATPKEVDRMFANGEIDFAMSYGPSFASERIARGEYPPTVRTLVFDGGTIGNYSFLAIPFNAQNTAGALVAIDYLMSPAAAIEKSRALGSVFPIALDRLSPDDRAAVEALPRGPATLSDAELAAHLVPEADATYLDRLERDWRERVLKR